jgi:hypothetical protein
LGLKEVKRSGVPALSIPYFDAQGVEVAVRLRLALQASAESAGRFRWRPRDKPVLYGLWRKHVVGECIVIVEGESDAQTLWLHGIPALGLPGASSWREEWSAPLEGIHSIYVVIEPDDGGEAMRRWIASSSIRDRVRLILLHEAKDPSELYLAAPSAFPEHWRAAMEAAIPWAEYAQARDEERCARALQLCAELVAEPDILSHFAETMDRAGVVGEARAAKLTYLVVTSRLLKRPIAAVVKGPSSAGKSFLCERVLEFFPERSYYALSAMSERALAYSEEPLEHRILVLYEAAGLDSEFGSYLMRSLLSEGRVRYETVDKTRGGLKARLIERKGPTGLLLTTTAIQLDAELETRLLSIPVSDSPEQTARVLASQAADRPTVDFGPWQALQEWLEIAEDRVVIPFAPRLAELVPPAAVRLRRDFSVVLNLIRAHAILQQKSRARDGDGQIVASLADYAAVRDLILDLISEGVEVVISPATRDTVDAVRQLTETAGGAPTVQAVARFLGLDKSSAWRRVRKATADGYLVNSEERRGHPARLALGDHLPDEREILPAPELLHGDGCTVATDSTEQGRPLSPDGARDGLTRANEARGDGPRHSETLPAALQERLDASWECPGSRVAQNGAETPRQAFGTPSCTQLDFLIELAP